MEVSAAKPHHGRLGGVHVVDAPHGANGSGDDAQAFEVGVTDSRRAMAYLVAPGSDDYIRIMAVLESSVTDLTPAEIAALA